VESGIPDILGADRGKYAGRCVLLVGSGPSAAATVNALADLAESEPATWVIWLARSPRKQPVARVANDPLKERDRLAMRANHLATRGEGNVEFHAGSVVSALEQTRDGWKVTARCGGRDQTWEVERIVANVGYAPSPSLCRELHVDADPGRPGGLRQAEPGYFLLGMRRQGRDGNFLLRQGYDHVREAFAVLVAGRRGLQ
jgi:thioredoxin reductase